MNPTPAAPESGADARVAFLRRPDAYAEPPARVDVVDTHFAWVFLAGRYA